MSWTYHEEINGVDVAYTDALWVDPLLAQRYPKEITDAWHRPQIGLTRKSIRNLSKLGLSGDGVIKFLLERIHRAECLDFQVMKARAPESRFVPPYRMKPGYVYFMYCESKNLMKIGCSHDPNKRLSPNAMDIGAPIEILRAIKFDGMYEAENEFHELFRRRRSHGEWFKIGPKQLKIVDWYLKRKERAE